MYNVYWFLDSVPTHDLGLTKEGIKINTEDYYVIGGVWGNLNSVYKVYKNLKLQRNSKGRKFIKHSKNLQLANDVLNNFIDSGKIRIFGTVFYHNQIPAMFRENPDLYVSEGFPDEVGLLGMQGRAYAQTIWLYMENFTKRYSDLNPIVCVDNEIHAIQNSVRFHFYNHLGKTRPDAKVKFHSVERVLQYERQGHIVSDIICSILGNFIKFPDEFEIFDELISKTEKFDSKLELISSDGRAQFKTQSVLEWTI